MAKAVPQAERLLHIVNELPDVIVTYDHDWRFTYLNQTGYATLARLGVDPHQAIGRIVWDLLPQLTGTKFEIESKRAVAEQRPVEYEEYLPELHAWFENRIIPTAEGAVAISRDITKRKEAEGALQDSEAQFRNMVDAIPNLAWIANADGWIFWYNRRWYEYTGTTQKQMEGWGWQSVHDPRVLPLVLERWTASIRTGQTFEMEFPLRSAEGIFRPFLTRVVPIKDSQGEIVRWVGTNTDISEQQAAMLERERLLASEREARAAAEEANRAKSQFLASMSHELRTPLNAIAGYSDLLEAGVHGELNPQQRGYMARVRRSQQILLGLINDLLNYTKLEAGRVHYDVQLFAVKPLMDSLAEIVEFEAKQSGIVLLIDIEDGIEVYADPEKLHQILINLSGNAIKAMRNGGRLEIRCTSDETETVFDVSDTGVGIPASKLEVIFEPFIQLDRDLTMPKDGSGLGLAISRDLAQAMNGTLTARSIVGEGSTFTVRLPARP